MLNERERERLLVLKRRMDILVGTNNFPKEIALVVDWIVRDWQKEINELEREDRL
jgi:hypothetical protein